MNAQKRKPRGLASTGAALRENSYTTNHNAFAAYIKPAAKLVSMTLPELAAQINMSVECARHAAVTAVEHALAAGAILLLAKDKVDHGEWERWLQDNTSLATRTAQAYIRLAKRFPELDQANAQRVAHLPLREAMTAISTKPESPPARKIEYERRNEARKSVKVLVDGIRSSCTKLSRHFDVGRRTVPKSKLSALKKQLLDAVNRIEVMEQGAVAFNTGLTIEGEAVEVA